MPTTGSTERALVAAIGITTVDGARSVEPGARVIVVTVAVVVAVIVVVAVTDCPPYERRELLDDAA